MPENKGTTFPDPHPRHRVPRGMAPHAKLGSDILCQSLESISCEACSHPGQRWDGEKWVCVRCGERV